MSKAGARSFLLLDTRSCVHVRRPGGESEYLVTFAGAGASWLLRGRDVIMEHGDRLAERFEEHRTHLRTVAYKILGSLSDAEDAVQESWLRLDRSKRDNIDNLGAWLTTVVSRVSLNMLRARKRRHATALDLLDDEPALVPGRDPEQQTALAESVGLALLVVLDRLSPAERVACV